MILITGGLGFIGSHLARKFKAEEHNVIIIDWANDPEQIHKMRALGIKTVNTNINHLRMHELKAKFKDVETIFHCAAQTAVTKSLLNPDFDYFQNAKGTFRVCELARKIDANIFYTSTNKVYGTNVNKMALKETPTRYTFVGPYSIDETYPIDLTQHSPYGVSKLVGDLYVQEYRYSYGLKNVVFRMSCIYGADQKGTVDQGWVSHFVRSICARKDITIFGNGKQVRDLLYIDDLVRLFELTHKNPIPGVFNIGGGRDNTISVLELINYINEFLFAEYEYINTYRIDYDKWREADQKVYISNSAKAQTIYKWSPIISPLAGIAQCIDYIMRQKDDPV